jgi:hypothetical protein
MRVTNPGHCRTIGCRNHAHYQKHQLCANCYSGIWRLTRHRTLRGLEELAQKYSLYQARITMVKGGSVHITVAKKRKRKYQQRSSNVQSIHRNQVHAA